MKNENKKPKVTKKVSLKKKITPAPVSLEEVALDAELVVKKVSKKIDEVLKEMED